MQLVNGVVTLSDLMRQISDVYSSFEDVLMRRPGNYRRSVLNGLWIVIFFTIYLCFVLVYEVQSLSASVGILHPSTVYRTVMHTGRVA